MRLRGSIIRDGALIHQHVDSWPEILRELDEIPPVMLIDNIMFDALGEVMYDANLW